MIQVDEANRSKHFPLVLYKTKRSRYLCVLYIVTQVFLLLPAALVYPGVCSKQ